MTDEQILIEFKKEWELYKKTLMAQYPAEEGQEWNFTCEHHKKIDKILKG